MSVSPETATKSFVSRLISTWRGGNSPDAEEFLSQHPDMRNQKSLVLDLAYEEYCLRKEAGETIAASTYCDRFPTFRRSLRRLIDVHDCVEQDPCLVDTVDESDWPAVGSTFLGFDLKRELGRGAFARVFLATQPSLGRRPVVVKISQFGAGEAETLGRLAHRNIVPVHSVSEDETTHMTAICMPYLGSGTLTNVLDAGFADDRPPEQAKIILEVAGQEAILDAVPRMYRSVDSRLQRGAYVDGVVHLIAQLADALSHAHQSGICHGDLKPSNILLPPSGCPMLLDFNLSCDVELEHTRIGGTLPYMPPEQLSSVVLENPSGDFAAGDPRSDVFSLGVILYELLTGHLPFGDKPPGEPAYDVAERLLEQQKEGCTPVRELNSRVNIGLAAVIEKCLALDLQQRPQSADLLASMLRKQIAPAAKMKRWAMRRRFLLSAGGIGLAAVSGSVVAGIALRPPLAVREYEKGIDAFQAGDLPKAINHFTIAGHARPDAYQPRFARGQALVALGQFLPARQHLKAVYSMAPQGCTAAWLAYCYDCLQSRTDSEPIYLEAIEEHGYETAAIWNNRGHNLRHLLHRHRLAVNYLTNAIAIDDKCQTAYHNRSAIYSQIGEKISSDGTRFGQLAITDIEQAITLGPVHAKLMYDAALIHMRFSRSENAQQRVVDYLRRAIDLGYPRESILTTPGLEKSICEQVSNHSTGTRVLEDRSMLICPANIFPPLTAE